MTPSQPDPDPPAEPSDTASVDSHDVAPAAILDRALALVRFLRDNCEWDAAQTPQSLLPHLVEEAYEVAHAVSAGSDDELQAELGDLLLNLAFQIVLAAERDAFTADDVVATLETKMRRRHPHLYGDGERVDWHELKRRERDLHSAASDAPDSLLDDVAAGLEPLARAHLVQQRVATVGFDWPTAHSAFEKVNEELEEVRELIDARQEPDDAERVEEEIGDLLFATVNLARLSGVHAMRALIRANTKFERRFRTLESLAAKRHVVLGEATLAELDVLWDEVKRQEPPSAGDS